MQILYNWFQSQLLTSPERRRQHTCTRTGIGGGNREWRWRQPLNQIHLRAAFGYQINGTAHFNEATQTTPKREQWNSKEGWRLSPEWVYRNTGILKESIRMCTYESSLSHYHVYGDCFRWGFYEAVVTAPLFVYQAGEYGIDCNKRVTPTWQVTHLQYLDEGMVPNNTAYQSTNARLSHSSCTYQHLSLQIWQISPTHAGHGWGEFQTLNDISNHSVGCCFLGDRVTNFLSTLKCS